MPSTLFLRTALFGKQSDSPRINVEESAQEVAQKAAAARLIDVTLKGDKGKVWISVDEVLGARDSD